MSAQTAAAAKVYPRVCGGNVCRPFYPPAAVGLSPRVRGKLMVGEAIGILRRSIPACAGETTSSTPGWGIPAVYPRVCGGNSGIADPDGAGGGLSPRVRGKRLVSFWALGLCRSIPACAGETRGHQKPAKKTGVYPRVCGGNFASDTPVLRVNGLSPRVRGKPTSSQPCGACPGSIPACAGETCWSFPSQRHMAVYPRVCGGNNAIASASKSR